MFYLNYPESCVKVGTWIVVLTSEPAVLDIILKLVTMSEETIKHRLGFNNCEILLQHQTIRDIDIIILSNTNFFSNRSCHDKIMAFRNTQKFFFIDLESIHTSSFGAHDG